MNGESRGSAKSFSRILQGVIDFGAPNTSSQPLHVLGVIPGEGIGPEVIQASLEVLSAIQLVTGRQFEIVKGGAIGFESEARGEEPLSQSIEEFCRDIFSRRGAVLCGPGGGRFVYALRKKFDLFCKMIPLIPFSALRNTGPMRTRYTKQVDILIVRDNAEGIYQGSWRETSNAGNRRVAEHTFAYSEGQVLRILTVAARLASARSGKMTVVLKDAGIPTISQLWRDCANSVSLREGVDCAFMNVDYATYALLQKANEFDVVVTSNLFGDILADASALLLGSRALSYSGNFSANGSAVYQTNHGAAFDLQGLNVANPVGQILSLAMLLRESYGLHRESNLIRKAVTKVWKDGWRTADLANRDSRIMGTSEITALIVQAIFSLSTSNLLRTKNRSA